MVINESNPEKSPPKEPDASENGENGEKFESMFSPGFRSVAAMAGWNEEAILVASLVVEDTPDRDVKEKKRSDLLFKTPPSNSRRRVFYSIFQVFRFVFVPRVLWFPLELSQILQTISPKIGTKQSRTLTLKLQNKHGHSGLKNLGTLTACAEETVASRNAFEITFHCSNLENKDLFSLSDPFLRISRIVEDGSSVPVCKTEVVNNLNPLWKLISLTSQQFESQILKKLTMIKLVQILSRHLLGSEIMRRF